MKDTKFCSNCEEVVSTSIIEENETYNVKGTDISVLSKKRICDKCGTALFDKELDNATLLNVYEKYKEQNNMLTSGEIKEIREKYFISQKGLALLLGWGEKTITRYENGSLQNKTHDDILKGIKSYEKFIEYWNKNKESLSESERNKIEEKLNLRESKVFILKIPYKRQTQYNMNVIGECFLNVNSEKQFESEKQIAYY